MSHTDDFLACVLREDRRTSTLFKSSPSRYAKAVRLRSKSSLNYAGWRVQPHFVEPVHYLQGGQRHLTVPIAKSGGSHP